jgi:hypothetical protein
MKVKTQLLCSSLLLSLVIVLTVAVPSERTAVARHGKADRLVDQLRDLELMRRNVEECYHAQTGAPVVESVCMLSRRNPETLNGALINRVFGYLAGTPEYERFVAAHRELVQRPDHRRLHTDELFREYMCLLESGRIRFLTQLKEWEESLGEGCLAQAHEGLAQFIPVKRVVSGHAQGSQRAGGWAKVSGLDACNQIGP